MTLFILSFFAGILTVLAPCVLPMLPVIVGGSLDTAGGGPSSGGSGSRPGSAGVGIPIEGLRGCRDRQQRGSQYHNEPANDERWNEKARSV